MNYSKHHSQIWQITWPHKRYMATNFSKSPNLRFNRQVLNYKMIIIFFPNFSFAFSSYY